MPPGSTTKHVAITDDLTRYISHGTDRQGMLPFVEANHIMVYQRFQFQYFMYKVFHGIMHVQNSSTFLLPSLANPTIVGLVGCVLPPLQD